MSLYLCSINRTERKKRKLVDVAQFWVPYALVSLNPDLSRGPLPLSIECVFVPPMWKVGPE